MAYGKRKSGEVGAHLRVTKEEATKWLEKKYEGVRPPREYWRMYLVRVRAFVCHVGWMRWDKLGMMRMSS